MSGLEWLPFVLIAMLGAPHGALDPVVAARTGWLNQPIAWAAFLTGYLAMAGIYGALWWAYPIAGLISFLLLSAWHFGGDQSQASRLQRTAYGLWVLLLPIAFSPDETQALFEMLTMTAVSWPSQSPWVALAAVAVVGVVQAPNAQRLEWLVLGLLAAVLSPLWYFVVFFCALHSPRHLIREFRSMDAGLRRIAPWVMLVTMIGTLLLALALHRYVPSFGLDSQAGWVRMTFIGLAALTLPHMCLIEVAERNERRAA